jgi:hypothetical protein
MTLRSLALLPALLLLFAGCGGDDDDGDSQAEADAGAEDASVPWENRTYLLEIPRQDWSEPRQIGDEIGEFVPHFLLQVGGSSEGSYELLMGTADAAGVQDMCNPTTRVETVAKPYPEIQIGPFEFVVRLVGADEVTTVYAALQELTITNILPDGDEPAEEGELQGSVDAREIYPLLHVLLEPSPEAACAAFESFEAACEPCPSDGEVFCLPGKAEFLGATELEDAVVEPIDQESLDPSCLEGVVAEDPEEQ